MSTTRLGINAAFDRPPAGDSRARFVIDMSTL